MKTKICFIGLGSIAKRHIRNLRSFQDRAFDITVIRSGKGAQMDKDIRELIDTVLFEEDEKPYFDAVFVTNPTSLHFRTLLKYKDISRCFFVEKPVFLTGEEDLYPFMDDGNIYYVACPLRYSAVLQYVKEHVSPADVYAVRAISSSYLPDWRPGTDYRKSYSANRVMGGGVSIDLIHEWDYLIWLFGMPQAVKSIITKTSDLEIDSDDTAIYLATYRDMTLELHLDYYGRVPIRRLELFTKEDTIEIDLLEQRISYLRAGETYRFDEERDDYQKRELLHFLNIMEGTKENDNTLTHAFRTLRVAVAKPD